MPETKSHAHPSTRQNKPKKEKHFVAAVNYQLELKSDEIAAAGKLSGAVLRCLFCHSMFVF